MNAWIVPKNYWHPIEGSQVIGNHNRYIGLIDVIRLTTKMAHFKINMSPLNTRRTILKTLTFLPTVIAMRSFTLFPVTMRSRIDMKSLQRIHSEKLFFEKLPEQKMKMTWKDESLNLDRCLRYHRFNWNFDR